MTFDEMLEQVITLLKRQGRVSYRALKRRFAIDDDYIEDLKEELLYVHPVLDDEGKGLVWTGIIEGTQDAVSPPPQPIHQAPLQQAQPPQIDPLPTAPHTPDAERRQLTVMFCDLVNSTFHRI
jgi:hypothetical protein